MIKLILIIILQIISILLIIWSFKLIGNNNKPSYTKTKTYDELSYRNNELFFDTIEEDNSSNYEKKHENNSFLKHEEDTILNSSVCELGIISGYVIILWTIISLILISIVYKMKENKYKTKKRILLSLFIINIISICLIAGFTSYLNFPLFIRSIPYLFIQSFFINYLFIKFPNKKPENI